MQARNLADKTAEGILDFIRDNHMRPGQKLPNEYQFSELLGVGRNTIREALRGLEIRNIVEIRQGAGTFVSPRQGLLDDPLGLSFIDDKARLVKDLLQVRCILEPQLAALAAQNASADDIGKLRQICQDLEALIERRDSFAEQDRQFHIQIAKCSHNMVMSRIIPIISAGVTIFSTTISQQEFDQTIKSHRQIYEAIRERRPHEAEQAMLYHLLYNQNRFLEEQRF